MEINYDQFILSYSDDLSFLEELKDAYLTHPLSGGEIVKPMLDAHSTRLLSIFIVGNIEAIIHRWKKEYNDIGKLEGYLKSGQITEIEIKVEKISKLFREYNIDIDEKIIFEYLGIKNLRNAIIHSEVNENKKEIFIKNNLPIDINNLNENIYDRLMVINKKMMRYINEYGLKKIKVDQKYIDILIEEKVPLKFFDNLQLIKEIKEIKEDNYEILSLKIRPNDYTGTLPYALDIRHISSILFNNLERINNQLHKTEQGDEKLVDKLVASAEYCWKEYTNIRFKEYSNMHIRDIDKDISIIKMLISDDNKQLENVDFPKSLHNARMINKAIVNYEIINLYISLLKYVQNDRRKEISEELNKIIESCKLKEYYNVYEKNNKYPVEFFNNIEDTIKKL